MEPEQVYSVRHFNHLDIPEDKLIAVDLQNSSHISGESKNFWPIYRDDNYKVYCNDILFIAWGTYRLECIIYDYVEQGGKCIIILGEEERGCTFGPDFFVNNPNWKVELHKVPGPASLYSERLSINIRK